MLMVEKEEGDCVGFGRASEVLPTTIQRWTTSDKLGIAYPLSLGRHSVWSALSLAQTFSAFCLYPPSGSFASLAHLLALRAHCPMRPLSCHAYSLYWPYITKRFELWRLLTSFCYAGSGLSLLFDLFMYHRTSVSLENESYLGRPDKYSWVILWLAVGIQVSTALQAE